MSDIRMTFGNPEYISMGGGIITNSVTYKASGVFQFGIRLYADHNSMVWLSHAVDEYPAKTNSEGWMRYLNPNPNFWIEAYWSGSYGSRSYIFDLFEKIYDSGWLTVVMDFNNAIIKVYRNGIYLVERSYSRMNTDLKNKQMVMTLQNYYSSPRGKCWFNDGAPGNPLRFPINDIPTLYQHLNISSYDCYEKDKNIYGIKI